MLKASASRSSALVPDSPHTEEQQEGLLSLLLQYFWAWVDGGGGGGVSLDLSTSYERT